MSALGKRDAADVVRATVKLEAAWSALRVVARRLAHDDPAGDVVHGVAGDLWSLRQSLMGLVSTEGKGHGDDGGTGAGAGGARGGGGADPDPA